LKRFWQEEVGILLTFKKRLHFLTRGQDFDLICPFLKFLNPLLATIEVYMCVGVCGGGIGCRYPLIAAAD